MNKTEIINKLIKDNKYNSYLEIGIGDGNNFKNIDVAYKIGVDPIADEIDDKGILTIATESDLFFEKADLKHDIIFIDGLHHSDQVERDIVNAWKTLNTGGCIILHDIKPHDEAMTIVPRKQKIWTGDVFRAWYGFVNTYPKIKTAFIDEQYGLGIIWKSKHKVELGFNMAELSLKDYKKFYLDAI